MPCSSVIIAKMTAGMKLWSCTTVKVMAKDHCGYHRWAGKDLTTFIFFFFNIQIYLPTKYFLHYKGKFSYVTGITFLCQGIAKQYWVQYRQKFGAKDLCTEILCYCWAFVVFVDSILISCQIMNEQKEAFILCNTDLKWANYVGCLCLWN